MLSTHSTTGVLVLAIQRTETEQANDINYN